MWLVVDLYISNSVDVLLDVDILLCAALESSNYDHFDSHQITNIWVASIGESTDQHHHFSENVWTDLLPYICQYDCK